MFLCTLSTLNLSGARETLHRPCTSQRQLDWLVLQFGRAATIISVMEQPGTHNNVMALLIRQCLQVSHQNACVVDGSHTEIHIRYHNS